VRGEARREGIIWCGPLCSQSVGFLGRQAARGFSGCEEKAGMENNMHAWKHKVVSRKLGTQKKESIYRSNEFQRIARCQTGRATECNGNMGGWSNVVGYDPRHTSVRFKT
jgi:hypothetical protein